MIEFLLGPLVAMEAVCEVYMSENQAVATLFPGVPMEKASVTLAKDDVARIEKASGEIVRGRDLTYYRGDGGQVVYIDRVLGKHEYITYAVGVDPAGRVVGVEVLEYRESYGHQIRRREWRAQFKGKELHSPLVLDEDVKNISGATLSCAHITKGVKRVLHTHATVRERIEARPSPDGNRGVHPGSRRA